MGRKTSGTLYTCGKNKFFYLRYRFDGKETRLRLLDLAGKPITSPKEARAAADRILAHIRETNRAEQLRTIQNDIRDAEQAAEQAAAQLVNSRATISGAWQLFMSCPKRPVSCRRFPVDAIPEHSTAGNYRRFLGKFQKFIEKNYPDARLLSDITPEIAADFPDWQIELWNTKEDSYFAVVQEEIRKYGLEKQIIYKGLTPNIYDIYKSADIIAFPAQYEAFGLALAEPMSLGIPAVGFRSAYAVNELIKDGKNGFLADDVKDFALKMKELMQNQELRIKLGKQAHEDMKKYSMENVVALWMQLIKSVSKQS